jgi:hypothetical protein
MFLPRRLSQIGMSLETLAFMVSSGFAAAPQATNLGPEDQAKQISGHRLRLVKPAQQSRSGHDGPADVRQTSPSYHKFLTLEGVQNPIRANSQRRPHS